MRIPILAVKLDGKDIVVLLIRPDGVCIWAEGGVLGPLSLVGFEQHVQRRIFMARWNGNGRTRW